MQTAMQLIGKKVQLDGKMYHVVKANNGEDVCLSLQNASSALFLRHKDGRLVETDENDNATFFATDSSFVPEERGDGFVLRCSNPGMEESYICKLDVDTYIVSEDLVEFIFFAMPSSMDESDEIHSSTIDTLSKETEINYGSKLVLNGVAYLLVPANDGNVAHISLLNPSNGRFARHYDGKIIESFPDGAELFPADSSFNPEIDKGYISLCCVNTGMENLAITYNEKDTGFVIGEKSEAFAFQKIGCDSPWEALKEIIANLGRIAEILAEKK